jgi:hypothetical protein
MENMTTLHTHKVNANYKSGKGESRANEQLNTRKLVNFRTELNKMFTYNLEVKRSPSLEYRDKASAAKELSESPLEMQRAISDLRVSNAKRLKQLMRVGN